MSRMGYSNNVVFGEKGTRGFQAVNAKVVKENAEPTKMRLLVVQVYYTQHRFHDIANGVMSVVTKLLSHQIDNVKSIDSPNNGPHELSWRNSLPNLFRGVVA
jgi:hypothetical protein